jgi:hypothetical protein
MSESDWPTKKSLKLGYFNDLNVADIVIKRQVSGFYVSQKFTDCKNELVGVSLSTFLPLGPGLSL